VPEKHAGRLYNTSAVFSPVGKMIAKHSKVSLSVSVCVCVCVTVHD